MPLVYKDESGYCSSMKTVIVQLGRDQLSGIIAETQPGDVIVLTDGDRRLALQAGPADAGALDAEEGRHELAAELLLGGKERRASYSREDIEEVAEEIRRAKEKLKAG
jgi:hypothetical protein